MVRGELARGPRQVLKGGHGEGAPSAPQSAQAPVPITIQGQLPALGSRRRLP